MARREKYTKLDKENWIRADHVKGMGDVDFKGFQCLSSECQNFIFVRKDEVGPEFEVVCPACGMIHRSGEVSKFFDYKLIDERDGHVIQTGEFSISHDAYLAEAQEYKYCLLCNTLKPTSFFSDHSSRASGKQGECRMCKILYNSIKNQTRLTDQHREAGMRRRLYYILSAEPGKIGSQAIYRRFGGKCFKCQSELTFQAQGRSDFHLDHTLPNRYLWPLTTDTATLLCGTCNNIKHDKWPNEVYTEPQLRHLAVLTGLPYDLLAGGPKLNDEAVQRLLVNVDQFLVSWIRYPNEIKKIRELVMQMQGIDIRDRASNWPSSLGT